MPQKTYEELDEMTKSLIYRGYVSGFSKEWLAEEYETTVEVVQRIIREGEELKIPLHVMPKVAPPPEVPTLTEIWEAREKALEVGLAVEDMTTETLERLLWFIEQELKKRKKR